MVMEANIQKNGKTFFKILWRIILRKSRRSQAVRFKIFQFLSTSAIEISCESTAVWKQAIPLSQGYRIFFALCKTMFHRTDIIIASWSYHRGIKLDIVLSYELCLRNYLNYKRSNVFHLFFSIMWQSLLFLNVFQEVKYIAFKI